MVHLLELRGFRTLLEALHGNPDGVAMAFPAHQPDVVLMDVQLPDLDGLSALRLLRANQATASIPVLALTAFAMKDDRARFLAAGFDGYLMKPIDIRTLPEEVRRFVGRSRDGHERIGAAAHHPGRRRHAS